MSSVPSDNHVRECPYCYTRAQFVLVKPDDNSRQGAQFQSSYNARITPTDEKSALQSTCVAVFRCVLCGGPLFVRGKGTNYSEVAIYPNKIPTASNDIPGAVRSIFLEMLQCFEVRAWNATGTMARKVIQEAVLEKGGTGKDLYAQIADLHAKGIITKALSEWAHEIRVIGRDGAHADPVFVDLTEKDAEFTVQFTEDFMNHIYVMPAQLAKRRAGSKQVGQTP